MTGAAELTCRNCASISPTHLLYYGDRPLWFCSPTCEAAWMADVFPRQLAQFLDPEDENDE